MFHSVIPNCTSSVSVLSINQHFSFFLAFRLALVEASAAVLFLTIACCLKELGVKIHDCWMGPDLLCLEGG